MNAFEILWRWALDRWQRMSMMASSFVPNPFMAARLKEMPDHLFLTKKKLNFLKIEMENIYNVWASVIALKLASGNTVGTSYSVS